MVRKRDELSKARERLINTDDRAFIEQVYNDFSSSKELKPTDDWETYDDYVEDDQWETPTAKDEWMPRPQINVCWKTLQSIHANMTSGKTSISVTCRKPYYDEIAKKVNDVTEVYWDTLDMDMKLNELEWIRPKLGSAVLKVAWNPRLNDGDGDVDTEVVHPANLFPDTNITNPLRLQRAEYVDVVMPKSFRYVLNTYDKKKDPLCKYTKAELEEILVPDGDLSDTEIYGDAVTAASGRVPTSIIGTAKSFRSWGRRELVKLHEYWYRDDNGKLQVAWVAGYVILKHSIDDPEMKKDGFYKHGRYPFVIIPYVQKDKRLWGRSEFQSLVSRDGDRDGVQDIINKLAQDYLVNNRLVGQGQLAYRHGAIKNPEKLSGEAGLKIPTKGNPRQDIVRIAGTPMNGALEAIDSFLTHADRLTNLWDVTQGRSTPYTKTAQGTMALLEQAMRPQNDKINTLNQGLREWAEILWAHLAEFVNTDREFVKNKADGQEVFDFNPAMLAKMPTRKKKKDADDWEEDPSRSNSLYFNFKFDVGATLAMTRAYMVELGLNLWGQKAIDIEGLYKLLPEFPGKQDTIDRMKAMSQQQPPPPQQDDGSQQVTEFINSLPPEVLQILQTMSPEEQTQHVTEMMQMPPDQLEAHLAEMVQGGGDVAMENGQAAAMGTYQGGY